ncbi:DUF4145 domain-containing protein [Paraburkholderia phenazinium]|uniref:DUF4145 domain-containing protein n=1 Tax=Paraburkholderia phenazinium TaxID=60549 RepID=A0A1N6HSN0_9BURK|nr:DUF4145 domain-containing protein [Paraburkholderia phenazinium]SIO22763.1 protein of unknown function [Paraburkholderia phenazinium]
MTKFYPPKFKEQQFHCVHCGVFSAQYWGGFQYRSQGSFLTHPKLDYCECLHCSAWSIWYEGRMLVPAVASVPPPHEDFPEAPKVDYDEARDIVGRSPKAAAALLRLSLQKLMRELGEKGVNINDDIKSLVAKGVPDFVQQALDYCRVVGNNAVHPGEIVIDDTPEVALALFEMLNVIVEVRVAIPKRIRAQYDELPEAARKAIEKRDAKPA